MCRELVEDRGKRAQFVKVGRSELIQAGLASGGEPDPCDTAVRWVRVTFHESGSGCAVHQLDHAVVPQQQVFGEVGDSGPLAVPVPLDCHQQLVLAGSEASPARLGLAPVHETAQAGAERQKVLEIILSQSGHASKVCRSPAC